jgi:hypothetical protein
VPLSTFRRSPLPVCTELCVSLRAEEEEEEVCICLWAGPNPGPDRPERPAGSLHATRNTLADDSCVRVQHLQGRDLSTPYWATKKKKPIFAKDAETQHNNG